MRPDLLRLGLVIIVSTTAGLLAGKVFLCLAAGLCAYLLWHFHVLKNLGRFARDSQEQNPPALPGVVNEIGREISFLRARHRQREEKLAGFLSRFEEATEALPDAVVVLDLEGRIEWANKKALEYFSIACPRDSGQRFSNLVRHPELTDYLARKGSGDASESLIISAPANADLSLEIRVFRYAGSSLLLEARDVTDIQLANRMRKDFIANASHELRTPLTVISGYLESFEGDADDCPPSWRPQLRQMRDQADRMGNLIEDLLMLSRLENETSQDADSEVSVTALLAEAQNEAQTLSGRQRHNFFLEADPALALKGNQDNLHSAFSNIVVNAVQHTPPAGEIRITWRRTGQGACLEVADSGEGIPQEHINRVTERFYRVDKGRSREKGGTGLGLAIVKHVMAQHDAELKISSEPGHGATVTCLFPESRVVSLPPSQSGSASP